MPKENKMSLRCYYSNDSLAANATLVFDDRNDVNLWRRTDLNEPLPLCTSTPPASNSSCLVCLVEKSVSVVCRNLSETVDLMMEAAENPVQMSKNDCPKLLSDIPRDENGTLSDEHILAICVPIAIIAIIIIIIAIIIAAVVGYRYYKRQKKEQAGVNKHQSIEMKDLMAAADQRSPEME